MWPHLGKPLLLSNQNNTVPFGFYSANKVSSYRFLRTCLSAMSYCLLWVNCFGLVILNKSNTCLACCLVEAGVCTLYTDILTNKQSARMQVWAIHGNISGWPLFPEKQLLFGYVGNEMGVEGGVGWGGCTHLRKWPCALISRPQPVTSRNSMVCSFHRWGFTRSPSVFVLSQASFDNHLSWVRKWKNKFNGF